MRKNTQKGGGFREDWERDCGRKGGWIASEGRQYIYCIGVRTRVRVYESWMRRACVKRGRNTGNATYC